MSFKHARLSSPEGMPSPVAAIKPRIALPTPMGPTLPDAR